MSAVQISEYAMMKNGNGVTSSDRMYFCKDNYRPYIRTITFGNDLSNLPSNCTEENLCFDVTGDGSKKKVYGYLVDSGLKDSNNPEQSLYNLYIVSEAPIFAPADCSLFFAGFNNLVNINYNNNFNTSKVTNMSYMFLPAESGDWDSVVVLTISNNDVKPALLNKINNSNVELMKTLDLSYYSSLENLDLSSFNTSNVTNMGHMFSNCSSLTSLDLSGFNTSNVTNMYGMFEECSSLTTLDLNSFNTSNVTDMEHMFSYCSSLTGLDLSSFNTSNVISMTFIFRDCTSINNLDISLFYFKSLYEITNVSFKSLTTTINYIGTDNFSFSKIQSGHITINYTSTNESVVDQMIASYPNLLIKGKLITAPSSN